MELISTEIIRKQDATDALFPLKSKYVLDPIRDAVVTECIKEIDKIVGVERRPKGEWIRKEYYFDEWVDECSVCGEAYVMIDGTATENGYNYCPHCGADMRGEE